MEKYSYINAKPLAYALYFMGFRFKIITEDSGRKTYRFEDSEQFHKALHGILDLQKSVRSDM